MLVQALVLAHITMTYPVNRYGADQKEGPCGRTGGARSTNVTVLEPGATIQVAWNEPIDHPSHYRISFDADGDDAFVDPATMMEFNSNAAVLADGIEDVTASAQMVEVTLPDMECENCTLQLIQVMYDKPPYTIPGNDIYYNCADLALRVGGAGANPDASAPEPEPGAGDVGGGCSVRPGTRGGAGMLSLLLLGLVVGRVRRRA